MDVPWQTVADAFQEVGYRLEGSEPVDGVLEFVVGKNRFYHHVMPDGMVELSMFFRNLNQAVAIMSVRDPCIPDQLANGISLAMESQD
jgi:hypothetical protein